MNIILKFILPIFALISFTFDVPSRIDNAKPILSPILLSNGNDIEGNKIEAINSKSIQVKTENFLVNERSNESSIKENSKDEPQDIDARKYLADFSVKIDMELLRNDYKKIRELAFRGDAKFQYILGCIYLLGKGVDQSADQALMWFKRSADKGYKEGVEAAAVLYSTGKVDLNNSFSEGIEYMKKAAKQGSLFLQLELGKIYLNGINTQINPDEALIWFKMAANQGNSFAQLSVGYILETMMKDTLDNKKEAFLWYKKSAEGGDSTGQWFLGNMYHSGIGVVGDKTKAIELYELSASQGNSHAQCSLGLAYDYGDGVEKNYSKALYWYGKSANQGNGTAQYFLGRMYIVGRGIKKDVQKGIMFFTKAADQGNSSALNDLGSIYTEGIYVKKDPKKGFDLIMKSAIQGNSIAQLNLGKMFLTGNGTDKNYHEGISWLKKSTKQDNEEAIILLSTFLHGGEIIFLGKDATVVHMPNVNNLPETEAFQLLYSKANTDQFKEIWNILSPFKPSCKEIL